MRPAGGSRSGRCSWWCTVLVGSMLVRNACCLKQCFLEPPILQGNVQAASVERTRQRGLPATASTLRCRPPLANAAQQPILLSHRACHSTAAGFCQPTDTMKLKKLGSSDLEVSDVCLVSGWLRARSHCDVRSLAAIGGAVTGGLPAALPAAAIHRRRLHWRPALPICTLPASALQGTMTW